MIGVRAKPAAARTSSAQLEAVWCRNVERGEKCLFQKKPGNSFIIEPVVDVNVLCAFVTITPQAGDVAIDYLQDIGKLIAGAQAGHTL